MSATSTRGTNDPVADEDRLALAFLPVHKRAFGMAVGILAAFGLFLFTLGTLLLQADHFPLRLLSEYFYGYSVSVRGAFIGLLWAGLVGFVAGWFFAFVRNLAMAAMLFLVRTRAELRATRDFLDHL